VGKYALFKSGVSFSCKKHGDARLDIHTHGTNNTLDAVRAVYGTGASRHLLPLQVPPPLPARSSFRRRNTGYSLPARLYWGYMGQVRPY
jgi:DNA mismatch repair protein MLH1